MGFDADIFKWLDVRFGSASYWDNNVTKGDSGNKTKVRFANNETWLGFGFHFNRLHIDTQTDPMLFLDGFNFLSGRTNEMNWRISAVYDFGE
jgi:hypothetical protein